MDERSLRYKVKNLLQYFKDSIKKHQKCKHPKKHVEFLHNISENTDAFYCRLCKEKFIVTRCIVFIKKEDSE